MAVKIKIFEGKLEKPSTDSIIKPSNIVSAIIDQISLAVAKNTKKYMVNKKSIKIILILKEMSEADENIVI